MNLQEAVEKMKDIHPGDPESAHSKADKILLAYLARNGAEQLAEAYEELDAKSGFWYA